MATEWLLDPIDGFNEGEEENSQLALPFVFLTTEALDYFSAMSRKRPAYDLERKIRKLISKSIWPRLLISKLRSLISTGLSLFFDGHWEFLEQALGFIKSAVSYLSLTTHGLRFMMSTGHLIKIVTTSDQASAEVFQYLKYSWFELYTDIQGILSSLISDYQFISFGLMVLGLILVAIRAWNEEQQLIQHIKKINLTLSQHDLLPEQMKELKFAKAHAEAMLLYNKKKLVFNFGIRLLTTSLFAIKNILLPIILVSATTSLLIPFVFALTSFFITLATPFLKQNLLENKPRFNKQTGASQYFLTANQNTFFSVAENIGDQHEFEPNGYFRILND
jgi:hypothetical protein